MTRRLTLTVPAEFDGRDAMAFLKHQGFSKKLIIKLKGDGGLTRGGKILRTVDIVRAGDVIDVEIQDSGGAEPNHDVPAEIAFEDNDVIVFDKPPNVPVHPSIIHYNDTLGNLFAALCPNSAFRAVYRLDKDTSGLVLVAKNKLAAARLAHNVDKTYYAVVDGEITQSGRIEAPIGRSPKSIIMREVRADGQPAVTEYKPVLTNNGRTLLEIKLLTGRTHQIRVHFSHIGFPLCGDDFYGGDRTDIQRHALHCGKIRFRSLNGEEMTVESPLPADIANLIE